MQSQNQQQQQQDPFDVFGSDDQDDNDDDEMLEPNRAATDDDGCAAAAAAGAAARFMTTTQQQQPKQQQPPHHRDPSCGPLVFHHGTEVALLQFVERNIMIRSSLTCTTTAATAATTTTGQEEEEEEPRRRRREERVIHLIDEFCYSRHWMMHIGPEKGAILDRFLVQSLERHCASRRGQQQKQQRISPFALVEVGTYCGYSTIRIAHTILQWKQEQKQQQQQKVEAATAAGAADAQQDEISTIDFHIFTVDINPPTVAIARQLVSLAGLDAYVTFLLLPERKHGHDDDIDDDALSKTIQAALQEKYNTRTAVAASFVFLDHDKYKYLTDLKQLERARIIRGGQTSVAADNVIFHGLDNYRHHMQEYADRGIVETRLEMGQLEYTVVHRAVAAAADVVDDNDGGDAVFLPGTTTVTSRAALPGNKQRHLQTNADFRDGLELTYYLKDPY